MSPSLLYKCYAKGKLGRLTISNILWDRGRCNLQVNLAQLVRHCLGVRRGKWWADVFDVRPIATECICVFGSVIRESRAKAFPNDLDIMVIAQHNPNLEKHISPEYHERSVTVPDDYFWGYYGGSSGSHEEIHTSVDGPVKVIGDAPGNHSKVLGLHILYRTADELCSGIQSNDELSQNVCVHGVPVVGAENFYRLTGMVLVYREPVMRRVVQWSQAQRVWNAEV